LFKKPTFLIDVPILINPYVGIYVAASVFISGAKSYFIVRGSFLCLNPKDLKNKKSETLLDF
jgi:hypothetical protein